MEKWQVFHMNTVFFLISIIKAKFEMKRYETYPLNQVLLLNTGKVHKEIGRNILLVLPFNLQFDSALKIKKWQTYTVNNESLSNISFTW